MRRLLLMGIAAFFLTATSAAAQVYSHNNSTMELRWLGEGDSMQIVYLSPRSGLPVARGTVLFQGAWTAGGYIYGRARIFSSTCGPIEYEVSGYALPNGDIQLEGAAPIRNSRCQLTGYVWNDNSYLYFRYLYN